MESYLAFMAAMRSLEDWRFPIEGDLLLFFSYDARGSYGA